jgi:hypothetical protein
MRVRNDRHARHEGVGLTLCFIESMRLLRCIGASCWSGTSTCFIAFLKRRFQMVIKGCKTALIAFRKCLFLSQPCMTRVPGGASPSVRWVRVMVFWSDDWTTPTSDSQVACRWPGIET